MKHLIPLVTLLISLFSCTGKHDANYNAGDMGMAENRTFFAATPESSLSAEIDPATGSHMATKKIIRDGRMELKVRSLDTARGQADSLVTRLGGYYASESLSNYGLETSLHLRIRIPAAAFDALVEGLTNSGGEVVFKNIDLRDVTDQFIDLESRLHTKRQYLARYRELLKQARSVSEILEIEAQIRQLEEELDSTAGRLKYLADQVDLSTLNLTLTHKKPYSFTPEERGKFTEKLKQSLINGWYSSVDLFLLILGIWPLWVIIVAIVWSVKRFKKRQVQQGP